MNRRKLYRNRDSRSIIGTAGSCIVIIEIVVDDVQNVSRYTIGIDKIIGDLKRVRNWLSLPHRELNALKSRNMRPL